MILLRLRTAWRALRGRDYEEELRSQLFSMGNLARENAEFHRMMNSQPVEVRSWELTDHGWCHEDARRVMRYELVARCYAVPREVLRLFSCKYDTLVGSLEIDEFLAAQVEGTKVIRDRVVMVGADMGGKLTERLLLNRRLR